jgi:hypothetical protein
VLLGRLVRLQPRRRLESAHGTACVPG